MRIPQKMNILLKMKFSTVRDQHIIGEEVKEMITESLEITVTKDMTTINQEITMTKGISNPIARLKGTHLINGEDQMIEDSSALQGNTGRGYQNVIYANR